MSCRSVAVLFRVVLSFVFFLSSLSAPAVGQAAQENPALRVSKHEHVPGELLVKFRAHAAPRKAEAAVRALGAKELMSFKRPRKLAATPVERWRLAKFGPGVDLAKVRERLLRNPHVELVEYNYRVSINLAPNDPLYPQLWGMNNLGQTGGTPDADVDALQAWDLQTGSQDVVVAVIDTGVAYNHPDLAANAWTNPGEIAGNGLDDDGNGYIDDVHGYDFANLDADPYDDHGHGTHVSGTIAAAGNNGIGVTGVSWQARIMGVKFLGADGSGSTSGAIDAVLYAADMGARVMNNSWGGGGYSQALYDAIVTADQAGSLFAAAAGNSSTNNDVTPHYPSNYDVPNVLAVAATDHNDQLAWFSSYGATSVDLGAPGADILSTVPTFGDPCCSDPSGYMLLSGTSMATPHVSGAAALLFAQFPGITHHQVKARLMTAAEPIPALQGITVTGGRLNVLNAFEDDSTPPDAVTDLAVVNAGGYSVTLAWGATGDDGQAGQASTYELRYSAAPIDEANFAAATLAGMIPATGPAGTVETATVQGLEPQTGYFFALKVRDNVGNASELSNVAAAMTTPVAVLFKDDFESGSGNWTVAGSDGVGGPALWHISSHRSASPNNAMYYGKESTLTFDTGAPNYGSITSAPISLAAAKDSRLTFNYFLATENLAPYDTARVQVSADDGATWTDLLVTAMTSSGMVKQSVDLAAYDGKVVRLRFAFDTVDSIANYFEGWVVDDVVISATSTEDDTAPPAPVADLTALAATEQAITLGWTATGDDGYVGTASAYDLRYSTAPIDDFSFDAATPVAGEPVPGPAGAAESFTVGDLSPGTAYYFALKVIDNLGNRSGLSNVTMAETRPITVLFSDDFESGDGKWTVAGNDGVGGPALWHLSTHRAASPVSAMYYGRADTLTYDTGARNFGAVTSAPINLTEVTGASLGFDYFLATENLAPYDGARVEISGDDGASWQTLFSTSNGTGAQMSHVELSLAAYHGHVIQLRFSFDTVDSAYNQFEGWVIDNVKVQGAAPPNQQPTAHPGGPYAGEVGTPVVFDGTASSDADGDPLTYAWNFGDGTSDTGPTPSHVYSAPGVYTVTLVVNDGRADSQPAATAATITVANAPPVAQISGPTSAWRQQVVYFDGSGSTDPNGDSLTYAWDFGDGSVGSGAKPSHLYTATGTYVVTLVVDDGKLKSAPVTWSITVTNAPPAANAGPDQAVPQQTLVTLNGTASLDIDGQIVSYAWKQIGGDKKVRLTGADTATPSFTAPRVPSPYVYQLHFQLTVTDNDGVSSTDQVTINVLSPLL